MNPELPSIQLWLCRTRDNYALDVMRMLNYGSRAIYFRGLFKPDDFATAGPLQDYQNLAAGRQSLRASFQNALTNFAGSAPSHWPAPNKQGAFFKLNFGQIFTLKMRQLSPGTQRHYYSVAVTLAPGIQDDAGQVLFPDRANIRLDRVRLWLIGAKVKPDETGVCALNVVITQLGKELIQSGTRQATVFQHDPVVMNFTYDTTGVAKIADCTNRRVLNTQFLPSYYIGQGDPGDDSVAAIGPWTTWKLEVREEEHSGLDMSGVSEAYLEFGGYSSPFRTAYV